MFSKRISMIIIVLIGVLVIVGCGGSDSSDSPTTTDFNLNIAIKDETGSSLTTDLIVLLDSSDKRVDSSTDGISTYKFTELKNDTYTLIVGKEGYKAHIDEFYSDQDISKTITLKETNDYTSVNIAVINDKGKPVDNAIVTATRYDQIADKGMTTDGQDRLDFIWRGIPYEYQIEKDGYSTDLGTYYNIYDTGEITFTISKSTSQISSTGIEKYIFEEGEDKTINLGSLSSGQEVIIGITPLNLDPTYSDEYTGQIDLNLTSQNLNTNLMKLPTNKEPKANELNSNTYPSDPTTDYSFDLDLRNRELELVQQYGLNKELQFSPQSTTPAKERIFYVVDDVQSGTYDEVTADLHEYDHCYIYVDRASTITDSTVDTLGNEFTSNIFKTTMDNFANHNYSEYDRDGNGKPIILITPLQSDSEGTVMGFFFGGDYYTSEELEYSNQADMVYLNSAALSSNFDTIDLLSTLAHELQHLIFFNEKYFFAERYTTQDIWINEGFATLAESLNGYYDYSDDSRIYSTDKGYFNKTTEESLLRWDGYLSDYGAVSLFTHYLYQQYGSTIIKEINTSPYDAIELLSTNERPFANIYLDWLATNYLWPDDLSETALDYETDLGGQPAITDLTGSSTFTIQPTAVKYYRITGDNSDATITITLPEETGVFIYKK